MRRDAEGAEARSVTLLIVCCALAIGLGTARMPASWVGTWASSQQLIAPADLPPSHSFGNTTLRQVVRVSIGATRLRVRLSNAFGRTELAIASIHIARSAGAGAIEKGTDRPVRFHAHDSVTIPPGGVGVSDPIQFTLPSLSDVAITIRVRGAPADVTGHPGSRTTSYLRPEAAVAAIDLDGAARIDHWYFLSGIDVLAPEGAAAVAVLGDSIADGRGSTTNGNDRWPDNLARRLQAGSATSNVAVLNLGVGGNRLLRDGVGESALARLDRDVFAQAGVRWLIVAEGINDIGTGATAGDVIRAYEQIIDRARARHVLVYGATIMPFEGFTYANYYTPESEAERQKVNDWIRTSGRFDAVIDFDAATRDPARPARLSPAVDGGDHLHPSAAGYRMMADAIELTLFRK